MKNALKYTYNQCVRYILFYEPPPGGPPSTLPSPETTPRGRPPRVKTLPFRCGLTEEDLDLTPEEVHEFS